MKWLLESRGGFHCVSVNYSCSSMQVQNKPTFITVDSYPGGNEGADQSRYSEAELAYFKDLILNQRASRLVDLERLRSQLSDAIEHAEDAGAYHSHMADNGTYASDQERLYLMIARQQKQLSLLDKALNRIANKSYGICKITGKRIAKERLEALPHTEVSIASKRMRSR